MQVPYPRAGWQRVVCPEFVLLYCYVLSSPWRRVSTWTASRTWGKFVNRPCSTMKSSVNHAPKKYASSRSSRQVPGHTVSQVSQSGYRKQHLIGVHIPGVRIDWQLWPFLIRMCSHVPCANIPIIRETHVHASVVWPEVGSLSALLLTTVSFVNYVAGLRFGEGALSRYQSRQIAK